MELEVIKTRLQERHHVRRQQLEATRISLLHKLRSQVWEIRHEFPSVTRVVVFGFLVRPGYYNEQSDVDIAITNLPNARYWQARKWFEERLETEKIDLVRLEDANPRILKHITRVRSSMTRSLESLRVTQVGDP
ncbi:hypothetical protein MJD09_16870 [bacterium]|nr:hypothetical protein [bacterium]